MHSHLLLSQSSPHQFLQVRIWQVRGLMLLYAHLCVGSAALGFSRWATEAMLVEEFKRYDYYMQPRIHLIMAEVRLEIAIIRNWWVQMIAVFFSGYYTGLSASSF